MIGRGALAMPNLAQVIKEKEAPYSWPQTLDLMIEYLFIQTHGDKEKYLPNRIKQWLTFMRLQQPQALLFLHHVRKIKTTKEMLEAIRHERATA
jgi:tRNA-dihydrouridine synthase C